MRQKRSEVDNGGIEKDDDWVSEDVERCKPIVYFLYSDSG